MVDLLTLDNLFTLAMLVFLQAVLGFDNLLYISIESKRVEPARQGFVRKVGIGLAIVLRIMLLFVVVHAIGAFQEPFAAPRVGALFSAEVNVHSLIVLAGGAFIMYTAVKEIFHMLSMEQLDADVEREPQRSVAAAIAWIVAMNLVFS
ncbi:MAG: tellurium resistance protein TerC, partial [Myxococcota bacterium]|nr:tellurium resistance protein TerC [Myxococcota bacterium]